MYVYIYIYIYIYSIIMSSTKYKQYSLLIKSKGIITTKHELYKYNTHNH